MHPERIIYQITSDEKTGQHQLLATFREYGEAAFSLFGSIVTTRIVGQLPIHLDQTDLEEEVEYQQKTFERKYCFTNGRDPQVLKNIHRSGPFDSDEKTIEEIEEAYKTNPNLD